MSKTFQLAVLLLGIFAGAGCVAKVQETTTPYRFKGYDATGTLLAQGTLKLEIVGPNKVEGHWEFHIVKPTEANRSHPLSGSGPLEGHIHGSRIDLNLNPGWSDNNVRLEGELTTTSFAGKWGFYGFAGRMLGGKFGAIKK